MPAADFDNFIKDFSSFQEINGKTDKILLNNVTRVFKIRKKQRYNNYTIIPCFVLQGLLLRVCFIPRRRYYFDGLCWRAKR